MHVATIMTGAPITVGESTGLDEALAKMDEHHIRHLPVVEHGKVVGILSDRDLLQVTAGLPSRVHAIRGGERLENMPASVGAIMRRDVVQISPRDHVAAASVEFLHRGIGCLPVVENGVLVGILTEMDLVMAYVKGLLAGPAEGEEEASVAGYMTEAPTTIRWFTKIGEAAAICRANGIRHLLVEEGDRLVGIVSDRDLRRAVGAGRHEDMPVDEVLSKEPLTTGPRTPLLEAARTMLEHKISCLPVLDDDRLVGILTLSDVLDHCLDTSPTRHESARRVET